jgi:hypothetical protein
MNKKNGELYALALLFLMSLSSFVSVKPVKKETPAPRIVNIINFIRQTEPRIPECTDEVLYQTVAEQVNILKKYQLKGTYLLQYDALINPKYQKLLKEEIARGSEVGGWWEITQPHVEAAGLKWRGRYPWDWHANVGFAVGYTPKEREKLVDVYMAKFKEIFGKYPSSIGSWFIDAHSLAYMYDKYHIVASCNCRDQVGTDGYTLWGGYWGQGYYPSRKNAYMPAQTSKGQIAVPIFRMLGSDPIYQYDSGLGGVVQSVATLEPVSAGGSKTWVDWFFKTMFGDPSLGFNYIQSGQENSFTWAKMKQGFEIQIPLIASLSQSGKAKVQTLEETGKWYKSQYPVTPPTALSALTDHEQNNRKTVWFNSRFYRANFLWEGSKLNIRDIHLFNEKYTSDYLNKPDSSTKCVYTTLPFVDGCLWSSRDKLAGLRIYYKNPSGKMEEVNGGTPVVRTHGKMMNVTWSLDNHLATFTFNLSEGELSVTCISKNKNFVWDMRLTTLPKVELPFTSIIYNKVEAVQHHFKYHVLSRQGSFVDCRKVSGDTVLQIKPKNNKIVLALNN